MHTQMGKYTPNFVRVYGRSIAAMDFPIPGRKKGNHNTRPDLRLKDVSLHQIIRQKGKIHSKEITAFDKEFMESSNTPLPQRMKEYTHLIHEASLDEIRKSDVILCTTTVAASPRVLRSANVHQVRIFTAFLKDYSTNQFSLFFPFKI